MSDIFAHLRSRGKKWISIITLIPKLGWLLAVSLVVINIIAGLAPIFFMFGSSSVIQSVVNFDDNYSGYEEIAFPFIVTLGALLVQGIVTPLRQSLGDLATRRVDGFCSQKLLVAGIAQAPVPLLESQNVIDKMSSAREGFLQNSITPGAAVVGFISLISRYTQLLSAIVLVALVVSPLAGLLVAFVAGVARVGNRSSLGRWSERAKKVTSTRRKRSYIYNTGVDVGLAKESRILNLLPWLLSRADSHSKEYFFEMWKERRNIFFVPFLIISTLVLLGSVLAFWQLESVATTGISAFSVALAIQGIIIPLAFGVFFPESDVQTEYGMTAYENLLELEQLFRVAGEDSSSITAEPAKPVSRSIRLEKVSFSYPGSDGPVLNGLNLDLEAGTSTAIVGLNGAGKSTVVKLVSKLYDPSGGNIYVDGVNLRDIDSQSWYTQIAIIFQDYSRYELDARSNIVFGAAQLPIDQKALLNAVHRAKADDVIKDLPHGLDSILSSRYSGGADLSGGQWQRIALARAFYAAETGASVLILDEPTAHLDVRSEAEFYNRFLDVTKGKTTILISHRFASIRRADRIVVLENGKILEDGNHQSLMKRGGIYAELFGLQAQRFTDEKMD